MTARARYSVHTGPKGGAEYRQWTNEHTFRVVSKYVAWPHLSEEDRQKTETIVATKKARQRAATEQAAAWRHIMRGG